MLARIVDAESREPDNTYRFYYKVARGVVGAVGRGAVDPFAVAMWGPKPRGVRWPVRTGAVLPHPTAWPVVTAAESPAPVREPAAAFLVDGCTGAQWVLRIENYLTFRAGDNWRPQCERFNNPNESYAVARGLLRRVFNDPFAPSCAMSDAEGRRRSVAGWWRQDTSSVHKCERQQVTATSETLSVRRDLGALGGRQRVREIAENPSARNVFEAVTA